MRLVDVASNHDVDWAMCLGVRLVGCSSENYHVDVVQEEVVVAEDVHLDFDFIIDNYEGSFAKFATVAYDAMKAAMIIPYGANEDDWWGDIQVNTFLNRLLALPIELQGHIFRFCELPAFLFPLTRPRPAHIAAMSEHYLGAS